VPESVPNVKLRRRIEIAIRVIAPLLDLVLLLGDRVSGVLEPDDPDYVPARTTREGESAPRGLRSKPRGASGRG
jgi:hypothetical protein